MGPPGIPAPRTSRRPGWGKGSCQKMRRWPRAADAAVAFIFKLPSGQRARRGRGPRRAGRLHPRPFRGPPPIPFSHLASGIPGAAPVPGSEREPLSMAATSLGVRGCLGGVSAATAAAASGQDRGPAAHHARPGPAGNDSKARGALAKVEAGSAGSLRARSSRPPSVCRLRPRSFCLPGAGPVAATAQPYCTARAGPGLAAGAYQVRRGEGHPCRAHP